jgi:phosphatidylglycerol:prolipoprotein diacylglycerol transferase
MIEFTTTSIKIFGFAIYYYGIILMLGVVAAAFMADWGARRRGLNREIVWDGLLWVLIGGIVGARLWHVFTPPPSMVAQGITTMYYLTHPLDLVNTRIGGMGIPGAIIGGGLALYWFCRRRKVSFGTWADIAAPGIALAQAIGRWGNYVNHEVYGHATSLPWGITIPGLPGKYHPLFLYESLWNLLNMGLLLWLGQRYAKWLKAGDLFLVYCVGYPVGRFLLEFLREDAAQVAGLNINQVLMLVVAVGAGGLLYWRHRAGMGEAEAKPIDQPEAEEDEEESDQQ